MLRFCYKGREIFKPQSSSAEGSSKNREGWTKMKLILGLTLLASLAAVTSAATCTYCRSTNQIRCGGVSCNTKADVVGGGKLPSGYYYIGNYYSHGGVPWFNLYKQRSSGGYWDYYTQIPEESCRGGFGLHPGTISEGCITVLERSCFNRIRDVINTYPAIPFYVTECRGCNSYFGCWWTSTVSRLCTTDLQVIE
jgi:hypothetical protein